ncbi:MAG: hypothetical protein QM669_16005, partial [Siphonobacter sp.]
MKEYVFWKPYQRLFFIGFLSFMIALAAWIVFAYRGIDNVAHWDILSELGEIPFPFEQFDVNGSHFTIGATAYSLTEQFVASPMNVFHPGTDWFCLSLGLIGGVLALTALTALPRIWYLVATTLFIILVSSLQLDTLWGRTDRLVTILVIAIFVGISFFFQAFRSSASLGSRFLVFSALSGVTLGIFYWI